MQRMKFSVTSKNKPMIWLGHHIDLIKLKITIIIDYNNSFIQE